MKKGRPPRKENRHVVQFGLLLRLDCRIPSLLQVKTLLLQYSSRVQMPRAQSSIHVVTRTRFRVQIIACSTCHASVGALGRSCCHKITYSMIFLPFSFIEPFGTKGRMLFIPKLNRTANSLISISNDRPKNHTYKNLCLNELAKFLRHHRCLYIVRAMA